MNALPGILRAPALSVDSAHRRRWALGILVATLLIWGVVDVRRRGVVDANNFGSHKTDLTVYTAAGAAFFDGREPYEVTNVRGWGYLYPPLFAMLMAPLATLPPTEQVLVWFVLSLLTVWGCVHEIRRLAEFICGAACRTWPKWLWYAPTLAVLLPTLNCLQRGQVGVLLLYLVLLGWRLCLEGRAAVSSLVAGIVLAAAIVLKVTPLLPVACLCAQLFLVVWHSSHRPDAVRRASCTSIGVVSGLLLLAVLLPSGLVGWNANLRHLETWWTLVGTKAGDPGYDKFAGDSHTVRNQSLANALERCGNWTAYQLGFGPNDRAAAEENAESIMTMDAPVVKRIVLATRILLVVLLAWPIWATARRQDRLAQAATFGIACVATLVASPIARGHYFMLLLPAVVFVPAWLIQAGRAVLAQRMAWSAAALVMLHYLLMKFTGRIGLLGIGISVWYVVAIVLIARGRVSQSAGRSHVAAESGQQTDALLCN